MALQINKEVTVSGGLTREGCYIQLVPHLVTKIESALIPIDVVIWANKESCDNNIPNSQIEKLLEVPSAFYINATGAPADNDADSVVTKILLWLNQVVAAEIINLNNWQESDITIIDL